MRRISPAFLLAALLLPSTALAQKAHHRMTPGEVLLSSGGDDAIQYIELLDASNESFPDGDYVLGIYDVDGVLIDSVTFGVAPSSTRVFVATAAADTEFGTTRDATLPVTLPENGQACFERDRGTKFGCMAWGCVNTVLTGSTTIPQTSGRGASPPDGMSLQRQADGTYDIAEPTPDATNVAGDATPACPTDPDAGPSDIDAGTGGDVDAGPNDPDAGGGSGDGGDGDDDDSGCGCRASSPNGTGTGLLLLVALIFVRRRRVRGTGTRT
jgi:MYXO-CTERM domain-containing protein